MSKEIRPVPDVTPETERFWNAASEGRLLLRACQDCMLIYHYPRALCPDCFSKEVDWIEAAGTGEVYSYSVARTMTDWPESELPLIVAYVELDEGPRILTNIDCPPDVLTIGTRVEVQFIDAEAVDVAIPVFVPLYD